ncbi:MAG: PA0069 family radical SAM protein [Pirellulales bacterium]
MRHGSHLNPPNRFESTETVPDVEHLEWDDEHLRGGPRREIVYLPDESKSIVSENNSPDIPFRYSVNPYRGCVHGCSYCYARNSHEYLGLNAGLDFETRILVKHDAAKLLRDFLRKPNWEVETIVFCGVTDCYQPAEREYRLTRACLETALEFRQPVSVITKNALVVRDLDVLRELAARRLVHVNLSITTLDPELARAMEPRTSIPAARLRAIELLSAAAVPTRVMASPMIPGLNDHELPAILKAARAAGAQDATYILLRLPQTVAPVFLEWLRRTQPTKADKVEGLIRQTHDGELNSPRFGERMRGVGPVADQIQSMFQVFYRKLAFTSLPPLDPAQFAAPTKQLRLFP